ncbi:conserved hypothetical protein [Leptospira interrogans serovar Manilae]|uniref:Uncharacterized protein n=1 Tax=Leptospira interrogans serovar Manilae TaxID=214675 RepID=A0AAQ1NZ26_LEPIR|nr:conserved hypothetical protein [Leptospira interrogans serovar Manilae]
MSKIKSVQFIEINRIRLSHTIVVLLIFKQMNIQSFNIRMAVFDKN